MVQCHLNMTDYSEELNVAKEAAHKAAEVIRDYQQRQSFSVNFKGRNDLVTDADMAAEEAILGILCERFPKDNILAEESSEEMHLPEGRTWLIDPIDGTTNFAHGFPIYCVSIGLWKNDQPKAVLVLEVNSGEVFEAVKERGAFLNGNRISVSKVSDANRAMIGTGFPYNDLSLVDHYITFFKWLLDQTQAVRRPGAASYDLCCVASGRFDGFYEYSLNPWDVGAASLIVQEAGGVISDWQGGDDWLFGERIVAGNPEIHQFLLDAIQNHFLAEELIKEADDK